MSESVKWNPWFAIPGFLNLLYIYIEITGDPCNLIGPQQFVLFKNHAIFLL